MCLHRFLLFICFLVVLFIVCMFVLVCELFKKLFVYHMMCTYYTVHGYWIVVCWLWNWSGWGCLGKLLGKETFRSKVSSCQNNSYLKSFNHTEQWEELKRNKAGELKKLVKIPCKMMSFFSDALISFDFMCLTQFSWFALVNTLNLRCSKYSGFFFTLRKNDHVVCKGPPPNLWP